MASKTTIISSCSWFLQVSWGLVSLVWAQPSGSACHLQVCWSDVAALLQGVVAGAALPWVTLILLLGQAGSPGCFKLTAEAQTGRQMCIRPLEV